LAAPRSDFTSAVEKRRAFPAVVPGNRLPLNPDEAFFWEVIAVAPGGRATYEGTGRFWVIVPTQI